MLLEAKMPVTACTMPGLSGHERVSTWSWVGVDEEAILNDGRGLNLMIRATSFSKMALNWIWPGLMTVQCVEANM